MGEGRDGRGILSPGLEVIDPLAFDLGCGSTPHLEDGECLPHVSVRRLEHLLERQVID